VFTDPLASPTGFPFKVAQLEGTTSELNIYEERTRVCDLGYLREPYFTPEGEIGYRCSAEPVATYVAKAAKSRKRRAANACATRCMANIGHAQIAQATAPMSRL
jgi:nitronate monooxygenase